MNSRYKPQFVRSLKKDIEKLPDEALESVEQAIDRILENPFRAGVKKLKACSAAGVIMRLRVGDYRIVYSVDSETRVILFLAVKNRKDVYRKVK
ncbi:MAG: type II toxin-antitoxin system RelE/ParE family toxin [Candidatus Wallbacteria bacterium]|nr:type II toxin-antitoxin system RelE/ParE family toxin [Candidatus Wallbacteria bacterium]